MVGRGAGRSPSHKGQTRKRGMDRPISLQEGWSYPALKGRGREKGSLLGAPLLGLLPGDHRGGSSSPLKLLTTLRTEDVTQLCKATTARKQSRTEITQDPTVTLMDSFSALAGDFEPPAGFTQHGKPPHKNLTQANSNEALLIVRM